MEQSKGRPATQIEIEAFTAIANLQDENRELRLKIQRLKDELDQKEAERLDACDRRNIAYAVVEDLQERMRELISACAIVSIFHQTAAAKVIDEEYQRLVIEPFETALARAKGESPVTYRQKPAEEWVTGKGEER